MPNNILITPGSASIQFSGSAANTIRLQIEQSGSVAFYGGSGSLFSITDVLSGSLMSVNDISGLPILEVFSDDRVVMGTFNANTLIVTGSRVAIGKTTPTTNLDVSGSVFITGSLVITGSSISTVDVNIPFRNRLIQNTQAGNYTLALADEGELIFMTSGGANTVTIPSSSTVNFPLGAQIKIIQSGAGQTSFISASTGVTLLSLNSALKISGRYGVADLIKTTANSWYILGNITT